jgi:two-component system invasion response regulator UvrY
MRSTIGLIDKNIIIRLGIGILITESDKYQIQEADNLTAYNLTYGATAPDLVILGNYGSANESIETIKQLRDIFPNTRSIVYDENEKPELTLSYLKLGVDAHIKKNCLSDEILHCIHEITQGRKYLSPDLLQNLLSSLHGRVMPAKLAIPLTERETQIAGLLCKGMRTNNIADSLERKPSTISTIKHAIFKKMHVKNILELSQAMGFQHQVNFPH